MAIDVPSEEQEYNNIIPLGEGYGTDPYNEDAVISAIATIREACAAKGHRCLIIVEPDDSPFFAGYLGSPQWLHFIGGRVMRMAMDEHGESLDAVCFDWENGGS